MFPSFISSFFAFQANAVHYNHTQPIIPKGFLWMFLTLAHGPHKLKHLDGLTNQNKIITPVGLRKYWGSSDWFEKMTPPQADPQKQSKTRQHTSKILGIKQINTKNGLKRIYYEQFAQSYLDWLIKFANQNLSTLSTRLWEAKVSFL